MTLNEAYDKAHAAWEKSCDDLALAKTRHDGTIGWYQEEVDRANKRLLEIEIKMNLEEVA